MSNYKDIIGSFGTLLLLDILLDKMEIIKNLDFNGFKDLRISGKAYSNNIEVLLKSSFLLRT